MSRARFTLPGLAIALTACGGAAEPEPMPVDTIVRVDTITITREVPPPLPEGRPATVCLASGQSVEVRVSARGDTLVGPARVALADLGPAIGFVGDYAADESWFVNDDAITLDGTRYARFGQPESRDCQSIKIVGDQDGVNLFADMTATEPFQVILAPVRPGVFQPYQAQVGRVRG